jgi:hypothetical protein
MSCILWLNECSPPFKVHPVVALNSALGFIKPLPIEERPLNQCHLLDQSIGDPVE